MIAEFLDLEWHIFECTKHKLTWYLKGIEVCQDFDLSKEGKFKSLEVRALKRLIQTNF